MPKRLQHWATITTIITACLAIAAWHSGCSVLMPGDRFRGTLPIVSAGQLSVAEQMRRDVEVLAGDLPERNAYNPKQYRQAEDYLAAELARAGYRVHFQTFEFTRPARRDFPEATLTASNLEVELPGTTTPDEIILVGAHYDAVLGSPGANDNASGTAGVLALARTLAANPLPRTVRFVLFANEEPPFFWSDGMGSLVHARACKQRGDHIVAMLSLETFGYYRDEKGTQGYPPGIALAYPSTGNFIAFVGMNESEPIIKRCVAAFRESCEFPSEGAALPSLVPRVGSSDHWAYWKQGYPALMVTDTAMFRYPHYHKPTDTPEKLDYERMARVVEGLRAVVEELASGS